MPRRRDTLKPDVLLPVRRPNRAWLLEALESVFMQASDINTLVVVLHPGDRSLMPMLDASPLKVRAVETRDDCSLPEALNVGLEACESPLVARMDQDDVSRPGRFGQQASFLAKNPDVAVVASHYQVVNAQGNLIGQTSSPADRESVRRGMRWKSVIAHSSTMFDLNIVREIGGYRPQASGAEDYDLWLRTLQNYDISIIASPLLVYRLHRDQMSSSTALSAAAIAAINESRLGLAKTRGESLNAARMRQMIWSARQMPRRLSRG